MPNEIKSYPTKEQEQPGEEEALIPILDVVGGFNVPEPLINVGDEQTATLSAKSPYETWQANPTPANLYAVTVSLKPTIDSVVASLGGSGSPDVAAKARVLAAKAVKSYDPSYGASLPTWVSQQLRQLTRQVRKSNNIISIPEGIQLDAFKLSNAEAEFVDENNREPTVIELADITGIPVKRITDVRTKMRPVAQESKFIDDSGNTALQHSSVDHYPEALDYVYNDSDLMDRRILEYTLGYGGHEILDNQQIMQTLKLTPVQLSRRKARLTMRVQDIVNNLEAL